VLTRKPIRPTPGVAPRRDVIEPGRCGVYDRVEEPERAHSLREAEVVQETDHRSEGLQDGDTGISVSVGQCRCGGEWARKIEAGAYRGAGGRAGDRRGASANDDLEPLALRCDVRVRAARCAVSAVSALGGGGKKPHAMTSRGSEFTEEKKENSRR